MISLTSEDLPLPETPVTQVNVPSGMLTSIPRRLFSRASRTVRNLPLPLRRLFGTAIFIFPERYCPVSERGDAMISSGVPAAMISPP